MIWDAGAYLRAAGGLLAALAALAVAVLWPLFAPIWLSVLGVVLLLIIMISFWGRWIGAAYPRLWYGDSVRAVRRWCRLLAVVFARTVLVLLPVFCLAWLVLVELVLPFIGDQAGTSLPLGGLIAGTAIAFGWLATAMVGDFRQALQADETRRDVMQALRGEIFTFVETLDTWSIEGDRKSAKDRIEAGGPLGEGGKGAYLVFWTQDSAPLVFQAVAADIKALDAAVLEIVIRFYAVYTDYCTVVADTRTEVVRALPPERQKSMVDVVLSRRELALTWGLTALEALNEALDVQDKTLRRKEKDGVLVNAGVGPIPRGEWPDR